MGDGLKQAVEQARAQHMDDAAIRQLLTSAGWPTAVVDAALKGIYVPLPPSAAPVSSGEEHVEKPAAGKPKLSNLEIALHHVLLLVFTASTSVTLGILVATLYGYESSQSVIASFLATSLVTILAYGAFYAHYLYREGHEHGLTIGRVWSIISVVLHSVVLLGALITFIATLINAGEHTKAPILTGAAAIAGLDLLVVVAYFSATFVSPARRLRQWLLLAYPVLIVLLVGGFALAGLAKLGPIKADEKTRHHLADAAKAVSTYTDNNGGQLPANGAAHGLKLPEGITYKKMEANQYQLCADFKSPSHDNYADFNSTDPTSGQGMEDSYVSDSNFTSYPVGHYCYKMHSSNAIITNDQTSTAAPAGSGAAINLDNSSPVISNGLLPNRSVR